MAHIILCHYDKGGVGKTTLAVHIAGVLRKEQLGQILLVDCDPRPDAWSFYKGRRPKYQEFLSSIDGWLDILWNPPDFNRQFKQIKKADLATYDYIVIDTDSPPEDMVTMMSNNYPDTIVIPINKSQKRSLNDLPSFLDTAADVEIRANREPGINYYPIFLVVPLGIEQDRVISKLEAANPKPKNCQVAPAMENFQDEIDSALEQNKYIWDCPGFASTYEYFYNLCHECLII